MGKGSQLILSMEDDQSFLAFIFNDHLLEILSSTVMCYDAMPARLWNQNRGAVWNIEERGICLGDYSAPALG